MSFLSVIPGVGAGALLVLVSRMLSYPTRVTALTWA